MIIRILGVLLLFALTGNPAVAHDPVSTQPVVNSVAVSATGTVNELVVRNQMTGETLRYFGLKLDSGGSYALTGTGLDMLTSGTRINATGTLSGSAFNITLFSVVATPQTTGRATAQTESKKAVLGTVALFHKDFFLQGKGEYGLAVRDAADHATQLNVAAIPDSLSIGMRVSADGQLAADGTSLDVSTITILGLPPAQQNGVAAAPVTNNVLVLPIKFTDTASEPFSVAQITTEFQTRVMPYYQEVSYGQQLLNVTVANKNGSWLNAGVATPSCDYTNIGNLADAAATAAGYNINSYQNRYYVMPSIGCGWAGLAYVGWGRAWSNGVNALWVYGHELGHNFGLYHAGSVNCGTQVLGGSCNVAEYGDPFDVMGNIRQMHFNAMQKSMLNWIPATSVKTHTSGTLTYQLSPLESGGQPTYAIKIPTSNANRTYWVEFRQPIGFDSPLSGLPNLGAQIRVSGPQFDYSSGSDDTQILDMTTDGGNFDNAALMQGQQYVDSTTGVTISVISATPGASGLLTVSVAMGGKPATTTMLSSSPNPSLSGAMVAFTATVTGAAPTGTVVVTSDGTAVCSGLTLPAGSASAKTVTCSTTTLGTGTHSIVATYAGDANNNGSSGSLSQTVNSVAPPPPGGSLVNPSFESPALGSSYQYAPTASGVGWTFANGSGIQGNGSAWAAAAAPAGTQTAFIQGTGTISQTLSLTAGSYTLSFKAAQRSCCVSPYVQPIQVSVDGTPVGSPVSPTSTSFASFSVAISIATSGTHTITFGGTTGGDKSTFIDDVTLSAGSPPPGGTLVNPSFESPALGNSYQYAPTASGVGWTFANGSGIQSNGSAWGAAAAPAGTQTAFIQSTGTISQALSLTAGSYTLSFKAAQRSCCVSPYVQPIQVSVDGTPVGNPVSPTSTAFTSFNIAFSIATGGTHTITFTGTSASDRTTFIDSVALASAGVTTTTALATSGTPSTVGANVTFTATVNGAAPTGSVAFKDGGNAISGCSAVALPAGSANAKIATCSTSGLSAATHSIVATYAGDAGNNGSTSATLAQVVNSGGGGGTDVVWINDSVPAGAIADGDEAWTWVTSNPTPFSGTKAHRSPLRGGEHQHYFYNATTTLSVGVGDSLFAYVYLDPVNPPSEVMLQWNDGNWEHRAYWGANQIAWGTNGTASLRFMGALPATSQWVRLSVPAAQVGLEGRTLNGMAFTLFGGKATWDRAGKHSGP